MMSKQTFLGFSRMPWRSHYHSRHVAGSVFLVALLAFCRGETWGQDNQNLKEKKNKIKSKACAKRTKRDQLWRTCWYVRADRTVANIRPWQIFSGK